EDSNESVCDSLWRSIYQVELVKEGLALRQAVTGPHTKNLTLPHTSKDGIPRTAAMTQTTGTEVP
ncbi:hypothetical protein, partial [Pseudomonas sp. RA_105y_Pfl2_P56]|uniref:hypothetical protein n=1 Tax=Pseudomonas sp. RA_105y_Pfl2_P56 TaxID=3088701 RepID=UPI0030D7909B